MPARARGTCEGGADPFAHSSKCVRRRTGGVVYSALQSRDGGWFRKILTGADRRDPCRELQEHRLECRCGPSTVPRFSTCSVGSGAECKSIRGESHWRSRKGKGSLPRQEQMRPETSGSFGRVQSSLFDLPEVAGEPPEHYGETPEVRPERVRRCVPC